MTRSFSSITQTILVAFSLKMAIDSKRSRSGATAGRRGAEKGIGLGKGGQPQLRSAVTVSSGAFNPVLYQIHVMAFEDLLNDPVIQKYPRAGGADGDAGRGRTARR